MDAAPQLIQRSYYFVDSQWSQPPYLRVIDPSLDPGLHVVDDFRIQGALKAHNTKSGSPKARFRLRKV